MDPHGIREALVIEQANQAGYYFDEIIGSLPFPMRVRKSYYIRKNLPFTYSLPKRIDRTFQGRTGLLAYDLIIVSGVDVCEFSPEEQLNLISYVEHGGAMIFTGGAYTFEKSDGTYHILGSILPVEINFPENSARISIPVDIEDKNLVKSQNVKLNKQHPVCKGLSSTMGTISVMHQLKPKKDATVVATCGNLPVVVLGKYANGRVSAITAIPDYDNLKGIIDQTSFFEHSDYDDFMRNIIMWLLKKEKEITIKSFSVKQQRKSRQLEIKAELEPTKEKIKRAQLEVYANDFDKQANGRTVEFSVSVLKKNLEIKNNRVKFLVRMPVILNLPPEELYKFSLTVQYGKDVNRDYKNIGLDPYEPVLHRRDTVISIKQACYIKIKNLEEEYVFMPGQKLRFEILPQPPELEKLVLEIKDPQGSIVFQKQDINPGSSYIFEYQIPLWRRGRYVLRVTGITHSQTFYAEYPFAIVHIKPVEDLIFVAPVNISGLTETRIREEVLDRVNKGFNCVISEQIKGKIPDRYKRNILYYRFLTQFEHKLYLWGEYTGLSCFVDHGPWYMEEGENPNIPCVLTDEFRKKTFDYVKPIIERAEKIPALLSMEIWDEPHALPANICRCNICLETFRKKYGYEMPKWSEITDVHGKKRYDFFDFIGDYYEKAFKDTYDAVLSYRSRVQANHVFALVGAGQYSTHFSFTDDVKWFPYCDTFEFDCYNYMYAHFAAAEKAMFHQFHFAFARYRNIAAYYRKQLGFFIQTDDRDYPHDIEPIKAPCEILYTAIGQNAKTFHLMYKPTFSVNFGLRQERWDIFGRELKRIRNASPLLKKLNKPSSKLAMFYPHTNWVINPQPKKLPPGYVGIGFYHKEERPFNKWYPSGYTPFNSYEFMFRYFGECDVIDERFVAKGLMDNYKAIALLATDYIHADAIEKIRGFVKNGGVLFMDRIPSYNQNGDRIDFFDEQLNFDCENLFGSIKIKTASYGNGKVYLLTGDLDEIYTDILISDDKRRESLLIEKFQDIFFNREKIFPNCISKNIIVEASLLSNNEFKCVTIVNHSRKPEKTTVCVFNPEYEVNLVVDLITYERFPVRRRDSWIEFDCDVEDLSGRFIGLYEKFPETIEIEGRDSYEKGEFLYLKILPESGGNIVKGEFLARIVCKDPEGDIESDKIISINSDGYIIGRPISINEITGKWDLDIEILHSGALKKFSWLVR
ncbi:MAG: hypothetical protein BWX89_01094 [candidate division TA06 bacterium ADurb.Bin131]|uniref:Putative glutamine amidotransferase domain-containing protein n=1 Tax=candidate division TA06 bacterium ADurb.Bin131 TaxID=1852827 RepID=A0A1V6C8E2_UNCT6|nr:MAG: hypothetical protein BWX89_01094 [candidate division TA06 bacterium ADurb.Bin131]